MSSVYSFSRPFTLPVRQGEPSGKKYQRAGLLSASSPLRFQPGLLKVPEGVHKPALDGRAGTSLSPSSTQSDHERVVTSYPLLAALSELADQETRILQISGIHKKQGVHWLSRAGAALGYTAGAGTIVSLYILVPALHLSSLTGLADWEHLVPFGLLGLAECSIVAIMRKTTAMKQPQRSRLDYLRAAYQQQVSERITPLIVRRDAWLPASPYAFPLVS